MGQNCVKRENFCHKIQFSGFLLLNIMEKIVKISTLWKFWSHYIYSTTAPYLFGAKFHDARCLQRPGCVVQSHSFSLISGTMTSNCSSYPFDTLTESRAHCTEIVVQKNLSNMGTYFWNWNERYFPMDHPIKINSGCLQ